MIGKHKRILITWATWFIWSNIVRRLISEWFTDVHIFARDDSNFSRINDILDKIHVHNIDFWDIFQVNAMVEKIHPEIIFHLATAWASVGKDLITINELYNSNVLGTINLLEACKNVWFDYFINTWSSSEYGQKDMPMKETDILEPNNDYWLSKASATMYCSYVWKGNQLPVYTFRIFSAYGYAEEKRRLIPTLLSNYMNWTTPSLSNPDSVRDYIFIDDIVDCYLNIDKITWDYGWIINIWSGVQYKISEIVNNIKAILDSQIDPAYWGESQKQIEPKYWISDNTKMSKIFENTLTTFSEWLKKTIERIKKNPDFYM